MAEGRKRIGRPNKITKEALRKLEEAFLLGCTDKEACFAAGIGMSTLYDYQKQNPEFSDRKALLKQNPIFKARKAVVDSLENDPVLALKYLERKRKDEFSTNYKLAGDGENPIIVKMPTITKDGVPMDFDTGN